MKNLFQHLARPPLATTVTVRDLLQKVNGGQVRVPHFQRPLRWTSGDVVQLLDSIWRGYPVGSLLFWKRAAAAGTVKVGGAHLEAPPIPDAWWIVDGQQRTTALAASMLELDHAGDRRWTVHFDTQRVELEAGPVAPERVGIDVPLVALGDLKRLGRWIRTYNPSDEVVATLEEVQQRLLDYSIPAYIVENDDEQALRAVFARLNGTGARMRADEVFRALLGASSSESPTTLDLDALQEACDVDGFGLPERSEVLKAVLAMSGLDPARRLDAFTVSAVPDLVSRDDASEALSRTVAFLTEECGIPQVSLIPYHVVFFILARWFHVHPRTEGPTRRMLARWVWRGAVTGAHQRAAVSRMREQVRVIEPNQDEQLSLDRLLEGTGQSSNGNWELKSFHWKSAHSRIETLAFLSQHPRDRYGPISLRELLSNGRIAREIFRAADLRALSSEGQRLGRTAANRVLLGTAHQGLSSEISRWSWPQDEEALISLLIDRECFELLRNQDTEGFLRRRSTFVVSAVEKLLRQRAAWEEPVLRPLSTYYGED